MIRTSNRVQDTARLFSVNIPNEKKNKDDETKEEGTFMATFLKEDEFDDDGWLTRVCINEKKKIFFSINI